MNVLGHGVDTVDILRFEKIFSDGRGKHLSRYFTDKELSESKDRDDGLEGLAKRLAAKEAVMKTLEHGFGDGLAFTDIEITTLPNGKPNPALHRKAAAIAHKKGIKNWFLSLSATSGIAMASAIACN